MGQIFHISFKKYMSIITPNIRKHQAYLQLLWKIKFRSEWKYDHLHYLSQNKGGPQTFYILGAISLKKWKVYTEQCIGDL